MKDIGEGGWTVIRESDDKVVLRNDAECVEPPLSGWYHPGQRMLWLPDIVCEEVSIYIYIYMYI